jgi:hypothetical protein
VIALSTAPLQDSRIAYTFFTMMWRIAAAAASCLPAARIKRFERLALIFFGLAAIESWFFSHELL